MQQQLAQSGHAALSVDAVLENILGFMPQSHRLMTASLVCGRWKAAALSVTADLGVSAAGSDALMLWLHQHGATLRSLAVFYDSMYSLTNYHYMDRLHQLTRLELNDMTERPDVLSSIGIFLTNLVHLRLDKMSWHTTSTPLWVEASSLWAGCSKLTCLQAIGCGLDEECVTTLGRSLPHLKTLDLSYNSHYLDISTLLSTSDSRDSSSGGCLQQLQALSAVGMSLTRTDVLGAYTQLTSLNVADVKLYDPGSLLLVLPRLVQLQHLNMCHWTWPFVDVAALHDALMPLTQLTLLDLCGTRYTHDYTAGVRGQRSQRGQQAMSGPFAGLYLPQLQVLSANEYDVWDHGRKGPGISLCWDGGLSVLCAAAPALHALSIRGGFALKAAGTELQPLTALAGTLTELQLGVERQLWDAHLQSLAQLRSLVGLSVQDVGYHITDRGILGLSTLSALRFLELTGVLSNHVSLEVHPWRGGQWPTGVIFKLHTRFNKDGQPKSTVAQQLRKLSAKSPCMQKQKLRQKLQAAKQEATEAREEAAKAQQQAAAAREEVKELQSQPAALQQQQ